jgi:hypothetical protein
LPALMLITTSAAGQSSPGAFIPAIDTCRTRRTGFLVCVGLGLGDGLGDVLLADGLGEAVEMAGDAATTGMFPRVPGPFTDDVAAVGRVAVAPPTAQASKPRMASPPASAITLRRQ